MLKFFRRIRKKLLNEGSVNKYLIYAIGEILLVMIGILLALQVNNWNEKQKLKEVRSQLIQDLKIELIIAHERIEPTIELGEAIVEKGNLFFKHVEKNDNRISKDSLSNLLEQILSGTPYDLQLPSYEEAKSSGRLSLLNSKEILKGYSNILIATQGHKLHRNIGTEMWYLGSMWEMRSKIGGRAVLTESNAKLPKNLKLSEEEFRSFLVNPNSYAAIENAHNMTNTTLGYLKRINTSIIEVIDLLEKSN